MTRFYPILLFFLACVALRGQEASYSYTSTALKADSISLYDIAGYFCDTSGRLELEDIRPRTALFVTAAPAGRKFSQDELHWLYFRIDNRHSEEAFSFALYLTSFYRCYVYQVGPHGVGEKRTGTINRTRKNYSGAYNLAYFDVPAGEEVAFFIKMDGRPFSSRYKNRTAELVMASPAFAKILVQRWQVEMSDSKVSSASFLAALLLMAVFTALMYAQNRERAYLAYTLYVASLFLYYLFRRSYTLHTPLSYFNEWRGHLEGLLLLATLLGYLYFIRVFLEVDAAREPHLNRALRVGARLVAGMMVLEIILLALFPLHEVLKFVYPVQNVLLLAGVWVVFRVWQMGGRFSRFIVWGTLSLIIGATAVVAADLVKKHYEIELQLSSFSYAQIGILAEVLIFGLGLGYRARTVREEKAEAELKALRAQMKPHFVFNSLNSIKDLIQKNRPEEAVGYLTKFARLMRGALKHSERSLIPLEDELEMCEHYLRLESLRFDHKFHFEIEAAPELGELMIPPLLFQPFLENAIWHGLLPKEEGDRWVKLGVFKQGAYIVGRVEDNGVGRKPQEGGRESFGLRLTQERLERQLPSGQVKITDKFDNFGNPAGTIIEISFKH